MLALSLGILGKTASFEVIKCPKMKTRKFNSYYIEKYCKKHVFNQENGEAGRAEREGECTVPVYSSWHRTLRWLDLHTALQILTPT